MTLRDQMRKGSTESSVLRLLADEPMYGHQISQELAAPTQWWLISK